MALLDEIAGTQPVNLDELAGETTLAPLRIPESAIKNRAALTALLSDNPETMQEEYQAMVSEAQEGVDYTRANLKGKADQSAVAMDMESLVQLLADPQAPIEMKQQAVLHMQSGKTSDTAMLVANRAAMQPSQGENVEQEDVRISGAEAFREVHESRQLVQSLKNKHKLGADQGTLATVVDFLELLTPYATNANSADTLQKVSKELGLSISKKEAALIPGSTTEAIRDALSQVPMDKRAEVTERIISIIESNNGIILTNDNNFQELATMTAIFEEGGYSTAEKWLDNIVGVLDTIGLGFTVKGVARARRLSQAIAESERAVAARAVTDTTSSVSPAATLSDANPEKARSLYAMVVQSEGDEVAQAVYGTNKTDAIAAQHVPQPAVATGTVEAKLVDPDRALRVIDPDAEVVRAVYDNGGIYLSHRDKVLASSKVMNDIQNVAGLMPLDNMTTVGLQGNKVSINAAYGTTEGGFQRADEAINQAKHALREYGVDDRDITILRRDGNEYVPVDIKEVTGVDGDYVVQLKMLHDINPDDVTGGLEAFDVKRNLFDQNPALHSSNAGSFSRWLLDAASMLHPSITGGAVNVADKAVRVDKALLRLHDKFADALSGFEKGRQAKVYEHLKEANYKEIELSDLDLTAKGFTAEEITAIKDWRKAWDTHYWLENADLVRTLQTQGYQIFENGNARLFAKPVGKASAPKRVYDPATDTVISPTAVDTDALYDAQGTYARLRRPTEFNGEVVEHMLVRNTPTEYLRGLRSFDQVLNYKKGYYQVHYKAPKFVSMSVKDAAGNVTGTKTIATASSTEEAEHLKARYARTMGLSPDDFQVRGDLKAFSPETDAYWDLQSTSGRIAQRHRGQRLEDASGPVNVTDSQHIADPIESAIRAARSLSGRVSARDFIEVSKARAMQQYGKFFPNGKWPENSSSLVNPGNMVSKEIADARTTVEYINYLQNGYVNSLDEVFKGGMNYIANQFAKMGASRLEKAALAGSKLSPAQVIKGTVFQAYIATNPFRQFLLQSHQQIRMLGYNPEYMFFGMTRDVIKYGEAFFPSKMAKMSQADKDMIKFVKDSGMLDAVDRSNLVRGSLTDMAEVGTRAGKIVGKALAVPRKAGFDLGEEYNLLAHLLAVRDKFIKEGKDLSDIAVRDEAYSLVRAMSYDMNFAGDMPYNQNWAAVFMQFFQVPHKAVTSVLFNRRIPVQTRMQLAATDLILWGVPGATLIANLVGEDALPEDPILREAVLFGVESVAMNSLFTRLAGKDSDIDFSSLSPYGLEGWAHLVNAFLTGGFVEVLNNSPSASIFWKEGSRMRDAIGRIARYTGFLDPYEGHSPEDITSVLDGILSISSGWTNAQKAKLILETSKLQNKQGVVLSEDAGWLEATAKMFGFSSQKEVLLYAASRELSEGSKSFKEDVESLTKSYMQVLSRQENLNNTDDEYVIKVLGAIKTVYADNPKAQEIAHAFLQKNMTSLKDSVIKRALDYANIKGAADSMNNFRNLKLLNDEEFEKAERLINDAQRKFKEE